MTQAVAENDYVVRTAPDTVRVERLLPGPIERVWQYLTESDKRATWFAGGETEPRAGGKMEFVFHHAVNLARDDDPPSPKFAPYAKEIRDVGRVTSWEPPRLLAYAWGDPSGENSDVRFELTPRGKDVLLVLTHSRVRSREQVQAVSGGWHVHLDFLAARLAGEAPPALWSRLAELDGEYAKRLAE